MGIEKPHSLDFMISRDVQATGKRLGGLFKRDFELAFELAGHRPGVLRDGDGITTRLSILFSPRERTAAASPILQIGGGDLFSAGVNDGQVRLDVGHVLRPGILPREPHIDFPGLALDLRGQINRRSLGVG